MSDLKEVSKEWKVCDRKRSHGSYTAAKKYMERWRARNSDPDPTMHPYKCPHGDHYHVGHATGYEAKRLINQEKKRQGKRKKRIFFDD